MSGTDPYESIVRYSLNDEPLTEEAAAWIADLLALHSGGKDISSDLCQARKDMRQRIRCEALRACYSIDNSYITLAAHLRRFVTSRAPNWLKDGEPDDISEWHRNAFRAYCTNLRIDLSPKQLRNIIEGN